MKTFLPLFAIILLTKATISQTTLIPDPNFEQALINQGLDTGTPDGVIPTSNIDTLSFLSVSFNISDLTGIEDFIALSILDCSYNDLLTNIDISNNTALTQLYCHYCSLTSLDVSQNTALTGLYCFGNELTSLDVSQNTSLMYLTCHANKFNNLDLSNNLYLLNLRCYGNNLTELDLSNNTELTSLHCGVNQLTCLDLTFNPLLTSLKCYNNQLEYLNVKNGNNINFTDFNTTNNPNLVCVEVDDDIYSTTNWTTIDSTVLFSTNCNNNCTLGINQQYSSEILLYPNPTSETLTISNFEKLKGLTELNFYSISGIKMLRMEEFKEKINISELANGIYFLKLIHQNGIEIIRFIKE